MSEPQVSSENSPVTPQEMKESNNRVRKDATRPGWIAVVGVIVFFGGLVAYISHF